MGMKSQKQKTIISYILNGRGEIKTSEANDLFRHQYHHNHEKYISEVLTRMVRKGYLQRVKRGVYKLGPAMKRPVKSIPNQSSLFHEQGTKTDHPERDVRCRHDRPPEGVLHHRQGDEGCPAKI